MFRFLVPGIIALGIAGCGADASGPPRIEIDRTACAHCGMLVSEAVFAAASQIDGEAAKVFDDIGCLLADRRVGHVSEHERVWVHDAESGVWLDGRRAVFVRSRAVRTPMNGGVLAFGDLVSAERAAHRHEGRVVRSLDALASDSGKDGAQ